MQRVRDRAPGTPLIYAIANACGVLAALETAVGSGVRHLSMSGVDLRPGDDLGLRHQAEFARWPDLLGEPAIHPRQLDSIHDVFTPSAQDLTWAQAVPGAFAAAGRNAVKPPDGEFAGLPVAGRAGACLTLPAGAGEPGQHVSL